MGTNRIKQRLNTYTSKKSVNTDTFLKVNFDGEQRVLPSDAINNVVNIGDRFNVERQASKFYRIIGTLNPTVSNPLFNLSGENSWSWFNDIDTFLNIPNPKYDEGFLTYPLSINDNLKEINGWFGYTDTDKRKKGLCNYIDMEPTRTRFSFVPDINSFKNSTNPIKNWELTISYPESTDKTHQMVNGGLLIIEALPADVSTRNMVALGVASLHNLSIGDTVNISGTTGYNGYYFVIDLPPTGVISLNSRMKKVVGGQESEYYFRKFKKIKTRSSNLIESDDYELYKLAFSKNIYDDEITQFTFNEDIDISGLVDNLGRPLSELYLTMIKTDSDGLFSSVSSGIETPFLTRLTTSNVNPYLRVIPSINRIHNGGALPFPSHTPLETQITISGNTFYGDLVEYNKFEVKETVLGEVSHRFNTLDRETTTPINYVSVVGSPPITTSINLGPRQEGYFYKAHNLIKIREFSSYVEQGDENTEGIPVYAENLNDGRYLWRDLLEIGFNESSETILDYPFLNGCHYMYNNSCFTLKRQDAFNAWGLYYSKFPADPIGLRLTDKFTTNSEEDVC